MAIARASLSAVHHELSTASALLCLTSAARPAGPKGGTYRPSTASYIYKLRCTCAVAFKCPARALIEVLCVACFVGGAGPSSMAAPPPATERVWFASGWPHDHGGPCLLQRGLPPTGACLFYHFGSSLLCAHDTLAVRLPLPRRTPRRTASGSMAPTAASPIPDGLRAPRTCDHSKARYRRASRTAATTRVPPQGRCR